MGGEIGIMCVALPPSKASHERVSEPTRPGERGQASMIKSNEVKHNSIGIVFMSAG